MRFQLMINYPMNNCGYQFNCLFQILLCYQYSSKPKHSLMIELYEEEKPFIGFKHINKNWIFVCF